MGFEITPKEAKKEIKESEGIKFPQAESIIRAFGKEYPDNSEKIEVVRDILYEFLEEELKNTQIYESKELGAAFPFTMIKTGDLAKKIFAKYLGKEAEISSDFGKRPGKKEFIFSSGSIMKSGYQFTFVEEAIHQTIVALGRDLESLERGEEPRDQEIYTLGLPTNEFGKISEEFGEKIKKDPFGTVAELQKEFIKSRISESDSKADNLYLYGISTGSSFAAATAQKLLEKGIATQAEALSDLPHLTVRMNAPVGLSKSNSKGWQIPLGYAIEAIYQTFKDPKFRLFDLKFMNQIKEYLNKRGIKENMSKEDVRLKKESIGAIIKSLKIGVEFNPTLKVTKVSGIFDPLMFSVGKYLEEKENRKQKEGTLGESLSDREEENRREFFINMPHTPEFIRKSEMKRYNKVVEFLLGLRK